MSFVTILASSNSISIVSDGRAVYTNLEGRETYEENYQKFKQLNSKSFFAYTGTKEVCEHIYTTHRGLYDGEYSLESIANTFYEDLKPHVQQGYIGSMAVGGFEHGRAKIYYFNHEQIENYQGVLNRIPRNEVSIDLIYLGGDNIPETIKEAMNNEFFEKLRISDANDFERHISLQKELVVEYSKQDNRYINDNCFAMFLTN